MIIVGLLVIIGAGIFGADLVFNNTYKVQSPEVFGQSIGLTNMAAIFMVGVFVGAAILLGIALIVWGMRHKGTKASRHRQERRDAQQSRNERDDLAAQNEQLRAERQTQTADVATPSSSDRGSVRAESGDAGVGDGAPVYAGNRAGDPESTGSDEKNRHGDI